MNNSPNTAAAPPAIVIMRTANRPSLAAWAASSELKKLVAGAAAGSGILAKTDEPCVSAPAGFSPTAAFSPASSPSAQSPLVHWPLAGCPAGTRGWCGL